jgi:hypothetical protein
MRVSTIIVTVGTMSLEAHSRPHDSRAPGLRFFRLIVFRMSAVPNRHRFLVGWLVGPSPSICRGRMGERTLRNGPRWSRRRGEWRRRLCPICVG